MSRILMTTMVGAMTLASAPAAATVLISGSGWQSDRIARIGQASDKSVWTFTVATLSTLSFVDRFAAGDRYSISGDINGVTNFNVGNATDVQAGGAIGVLWTNPAYSRALFVVGPGSYSFSVFGKMLDFAPSGFALRLDAGAPVPELASWALLITGFGIVGAALRRRPRVTVSYA